jgi:hypothetical protein
MNLLKLRADILLIVIATFMILNHGAMMIRMPPTAGAGLPVGELLIALFVLTLIFEVKRLPSFGYVAPLLPLFAFWSLSIFQILIALPEHGFWAVRDASHAIETTFLWIGFVVAASPGFFERFSRWLRWVLNLGVVYALLYPFREILSQLSPKLQAAGGYSVPLFFNYISAGLIPLTAAMSWLVDRFSLFRIPAVVLTGGLIVYCIVVFQMRTTYLQVIALFLVMSAIRPRVAMQMSVGVMFGFVALALVLASGIEITGRLGEKVSLDFVVQHFSAIWGASGDGMVKDSAQGVSQRLGWWIKIWENLNSSLHNILFGLGYGIPLTDFYFTGDVRVREPHNSLISIVARLGFVGVFFFIWFQLALARIWFRTYRWCLRNGEEMWKNNLLIIGVFFMLLWILSIGEDAFEKPYNTVVYYFLWGVILRVNYEILAPNGRFQKKQLLPNRVS